MKTLSEIKNAVYLVAPCNQPNKIKQAINAGIDILQLYKTEQLPLTEVEALCKYARIRDIPVFINNNYKILKDIEADGVHFDVLPQNIEDINYHIGRAYLKGLTLGNDTTVVNEALKSGFDYFSFCSMFPSKSVATCDLVKFEAVQKTRELTTKPIFLAGGIDYTTIDQLKGLIYNGIAVISAILETEDMARTIKFFKIKLQSHAPENI